MRTAIIDLAFGDCGKGRLSEYFGRDADWFVKYCGGNNAGHTVYKDGVKYRLNHLPAGSIFGKSVALDTGMLINFEALKSEVKSIQPFPLYISENVHLITPEHIKRDSDGSGIGTTKKGIAYAYADRALRVGKRVADLKQSELDDLGAIRYRGLPPIDKNANVIYEGSQGLMLDVDLGCWPFVTSSSVLPSCAHKINKIIGVFKAYCTRVGNGPPNHPDLNHIRELGGEYGTVTGRPRKTTWNDLDDLDYAISIVQPDEIVVTKLDVLKDIKDIRVYEGGVERVIGDLDTYKSFLLDRFPAIKWFSESPQGDLIKVR